MLALTSIPSALSVNHAVQQMFDTLQARITDRAALLLFSRQNDQLALKGHVVSRTLIKKEICLSEVGITRFKSTFVVLRCQGHDKVSLCHPQQINPEFNGSEEPADETQFNG
jgi:hypothetical protein